MEYYKNYYNKITINEDFENSCAAERDCSNEEALIEIVKHNPLTKKLFQSYEDSYKSHIKIKKIDNTKLLRPYIFKGEKINPDLCFNSSMVKYKDGFIFVYRTDLKYKNNRYCIKINVHICYLNSNFEVIGKPDVLHLYTNMSKTKDTYLKALKLDDGHHAEDPRIFWFQNKLMIVYGDGYYMYMGIINPETLRVETSKMLEHPFETYCEKNWTPIIKNNELHFIYSYCPHMIIFKMNKNNLWKIEKIFHRKNGLIDWKEKYGKIRGGTPFIEYNNNYICCFHSSKEAIPEIKFSKFYYCGLMIINKNFDVVAISSKPLFIADPIQYTYPRLCNKIFVIFPGGIVIDGDKLLICCGENDMNNIVLALNIKNINKYIKEV